MKAIPDRSIYYLGTAQVECQHLAYYGDRESDECTGCSSTDLEHNIPALITIDDYQLAISFAQILAEALYTIGPALRLGLPEDAVLHCLHGQSRLRMRTIETAQGHAEPWLTVDLYSSNMPADVIVHTRDHYRSHTPLCDGEKYLRIRYHQRRGEKAEELRWKKRLSVSKSKNVEQIVRNKLLVQCLDELEPFRPLWAAFQLGSFPPLLSWHCYEEIVHYLQNIRVMWNIFTNGNPFWCDESTVTNLQALAPRWSIRDRSTIKTAFKKNKVFPRVQDDDKRTSILQSVLATQGFILTFKTFFKHVKTLTPVMPKLRELFWPLKMNPSVQCVFKDAYTPTKDASDSEKCLVQTDDTNFCWMKALGNFSGSCAYWQLCLFLLRRERRHGTLDGMSKNTLRDESSPRYPSWLIELGHLALRLGFKSDRIFALTQKDAELSEIRKHLRCERPEILFSVSSEQFEAEALQRQERLAIFDRREMPPPPSMGTDDSSSEAEPDERVSLFLPTIQEALKQTPRQYLTPFGRLVLVLISFLGEVDVQAEEAMESHFTPAEYHTLVHAEAFHTGVHAEVVTDPQEVIVESPMLVDAQVETSTNTMISESPNNIQAHSTEQRSSSVYSNSQQPLNGDRSINEVKFWRLQPNGKVDPNLKPSRCLASPEFIEREMRDIVRQGKKNKLRTNFYMMKKGRLWTCPNVMRHYATSDTPYSVFYSFGERHWNALTRSTFKSSKLKLPDH